MTFLLAIIVFTIIAIEVPKMVRKKLWRELVIFGILLFFGTLYSLGYLYDLPLPNPTKKMEYMTEPVSKFLDELLLSGMK